MVTNSKNKTENPRKAGHGKKQKTEDGKGLGEETKIENGLDNLEQELLELRAKYARALADYQNLEKRTQEDKKQFAKISNVGLLSTFIPVFDHLIMAAKHLNDSGLDMVLNQLDQALVSEGVTTIEPIDVPFNPEEMDCVETVVGEPDMVIEVTKKGYKLGDYVLRPAQVKVGKVEE